MLNSEYLSLVNKIGDKTEFTITRVHCISILLIKDSLYLLSLSDLECCIANTWPKDPIWTDYFYGIFVCVIFYLNQAIKKFNSPFTMDSGKGGTSCRPRS